jgi:hypothetical protein
VAAFSLYGGVIKTISSGSTPPRADHSKQKELCQMVSLFPKPKACLTAGR